MKKNISANECKSMFNDKFSTLNMKEIGIELKHFSMGTAPENPSFLVNQDDLKKKIGNVIKQAIGVSVRVKLVEPKSIERSEGKAKRVIDNRNL